MITALISAMLLFQQVMSNLSETIKYSHSQTFNPSWSSMEYDTGVVLDSDGTLTVRLGSAVGGIAIKRVVVEGDQKQAEGKPL